MQFDVYKNAGSATFPLLLDVQANLLERLDTRVVVPLMPRKLFAIPLTRLTPEVVVADHEYVVVFPQLAVVPKTKLKTAMVSLALRRSDFIAALDLLFTGT